MSKPTYTFTQEGNLIRRNDGLKSDDPIMGIVQRPELWPPHAGAVLDLAGLLTDATFKAIQEKQKLKPDDDLPIQLGIVTNSGGVIRTPPVVFKSPDHKAFLMNTMAGVLRAINASALIIVTDARFINAEAFAEHFGIPKPGGRGHRAFLDAYGRIMDQHGNTQANLPRHLWNEALSVSLVGKGIAQVAMTKYTRKEGGGYLFEPTEMMYEGVEVGMISPWWD